MKTSWHVRRTVVARSDGQRRWDYVYQFLLQWAMEHEAGLCPAPSHHMEVALYVRVSTTRQQHTQTIEQQVAR